MKIALFFFLFVTLLVSSGCAVIDFLDGKDLNDAPNYDRPQSGPVSGGGGSSGGHFH